MEVIRPARGLFLDFPMGRSMGRPNDPELQNQVIRAAFKLFEAPVGPVLEDFPEIIPVRDGRMGYALPPELVLGIDDIGEVGELLAEVQAEVQLRFNYQNFARTGAFMTVALQPIQQRYRRVPTPLLPYRPSMDLAS